MQWQQCSLHKFQCYRTLSEAIRIGKVPGKWCLHQGLLKTEFLRNLGWHEGSSYRETSLPDPSVWEQTDTPEASHKHWRDCPHPAICRVQGLNCNLLRGKGQSFVVLLSIFWRLFKTLYFLTGRTNSLLTRVRETFCSSAEGLLSLLPILLPLQKRNKNKTRIK